MDDQKQLAIDKVLGIIGNLDNAIEDVIKRSIHSTHPKVKKQLALAERDLNRSRGALWYAVDVLRMEL